MSQFSVDRLKVSKNASLTLAIAVKNYILTLFFHKVMLIIFKMRCSASAEADFCAFFFRREHFFGYASTAIEIFRTNGSHVLMKYCNEQEKFLFVCNTRNSRQLVVELRSHLKYRLFSLLKILDPLHAAGHKIFFSTRANQCKKSLLCMMHKLRGNNFLPVWNVVFLAFLNSRP